MAKAEFRPTVQGPGPSAQLNPKAVEVMREVGYDLSQNQPKSLLDIPDKRYDAVVTMGCGDDCPLVEAKRREAWNIPDPKEMPLDGVREVRDLIQAQVKALVDTL